MCQNLSPGWLIVLIDELVYITVLDVTRSFYVANIVYVAVVIYTVMFIIA